MDIPSEIALNGEAEVTEMGDRSESGVAEENWVGRSRVLYGILREGYCLRLVATEDDLPLTSPFPKPTKVRVQLSVSGKTI